MKIAYIRWKDAMSVEGDSSPAKAVLSTLEEVGWVLDETDEVILIGMELDDPKECIPGRWRLNIPKGQIEEMRVLEWNKALPPRTRLL
jgi:hypothetical protein